MKKKTLEEKILDLSNACLEAGPEAFSGEHEYSCLLESLACAAHAVNGRYALYVSREEYDSVIRSRYPSNQ